MSDTNEVKKDTVYWTNLLQTELPALWEAKVQADRFLTEKLFEVWENLESICFKMAYRPLDHKDNPLPVRDKDKATMRWLMRKLGLPWNSYTQSLVDTFENGAFYLVAGGYSASKARLVSKYWHGLRITDHVKKDDSIVPCFSKALLEIMKLPVKQAEPLVQLLAAGQSVELPKKGDGMLLGDFMQILERFSKKSESKIRLGEAPLDKVQDAANAVKIQIEALEATYAQLLGHMQIAKVTTQAQAAEAQAAD